MYIRTLSLIKRKKLILPVKKVGKKGAKVADPVPVVRESPSFLETGSDVRSQGLTCY